MTKTCARNLAILAKILTDHNELLNVFGNHAKLTCCGPSSSLSGSASNSISGVTKSANSVGHGEWA